MQCETYHSAQKMKFSTKDFFSKCDQIHSAVPCGFGQIYRRNPSLETLFVCAVLSKVKVKVKLIQ